MQNEAERLTIGKAAKHLGVSIDSLRRWEKKGFIKSHRSPGGHRYFLKTDLQSIGGKKHRRTETEAESIQSTKISVPNVVQTTVKKGVRPLYIYLLAGFLILDLLLITVYILSI